MAANASTVYRPGTLPASSAATWSWRGRQRDGALAARQSHQAEPCDLGMCASTQMRLRDDSPHQR
jgi:hypothetical protein